MNVRYISLSQMVSEHSEKKSSTQNDKLPQADQPCTLGNRFSSGSDRWARHDVESSGTILTMAL